MCVAAPGKVVEVWRTETGGARAVVDFAGSRVNALSGLFEISPGDDVLVHAGCIIQKISQSEAEEMRTLIEEMRYV